MLLSLLSYHKESAVPESLASILPIAGIASAGSGLIGNILNSIQRGNVASQAAKNASLTPAQLGGMVSSATKPLDRSLVETVQNAVQADVASRGLAESPGIFAATESQALAPFQQQNQQTALQLIMEKLGLPAQTLYALSSGGGGYANLLPLLQSIMKMQQGKTASAPTQDQLLNLFNTNWQPTPAPGITTPNNWTGPTDIPTDGSVPA